jgi:tRNA threonylcarbamoyladenosine biosynthesis protein TsaB
MRILAFDTSSKTASVSILCDEVVLYETIINMGLNHSEVLLPVIEHACYQTGIKINDFDLFACTIGPGSFTGLRIGASTLKGFTLASGKPAVGVSSLAALALNVGKTSKKICSVMDAGRGQVYCACFQFQENGLLEQIGNEQVVKPSEMNNVQNTIYIGDGAIKYADIFNVPSNEIVFPYQSYCRGSCVGILGKEKYEKNELLDPDTFIPRYLRSHDAQI